MAGFKSFMMYSFLLLIVILSLQEMYREKLASSELFTILGVFIITLIFLVLIIGIFIYDLKAERLVSSLLKEKLYSKELQVRQMQAELATRGGENDILRFEMLKKDEYINYLQSALQESIRKLSIVKGILRRVSEERDRMWEKLIEFREQDMLLNSEINVLNEKIETLVEDIHVKEGQIKMLKESKMQKAFCQPWLQCGGN